MTKAVEWKATTSLSETVKMVNERIGRVVEAILVDSATEAMVSRMN